MKKGSFWKSDWFLAVIIVLLVFALSKTTTLIEALEIQAYDWGMNLTSKVPSDKIAIIKIDNESIANIGRWPWSRDVHAKMTDILAEAKPKVIGNTVFFFEPQVDPGLKYINRLLDIYKKDEGKSSNLEAVSGTSANMPAKPQGVEMAEFGAILSEAEQALNTDRHLAESIKKAGNVLLPAFFNYDFRPPIGNPDQPLPEFVVHNRIGGAVNAGGEFIYGVSPASVPIDPIGPAAAGIGHLSQVLDNDSGRRRELLVADYYGEQLPSLALLLAAKSYNLAPADIKVSLGESVNLGPLKILTDLNAQMHTYFYKNVDGKSAFQQDSFFDVFSGKIPAAKYRDKIVLIGADAAGVGQLQVTPVGSLSSVETLAHTVSSIVQQHFFRTPVWGGSVTAAVFLLVALYLILLLPRLRAGPAALITIGMLIALFVSHVVLMRGPGLWIELMLPATLLVLGHALLTTKRFLMTERGKEKSDAEGAESSRMLGLAFQQQGQLDMAFDKFRKCPVDEQLLENVYSLGLDFERRRQFNKAESAFLFIAGHDPAFRDVAERTKRARAMAETIILGGSSASRAAQATVLMSGAGEKPTLGRYQVEKELGKGAMGVVYLGKDPKIGREVAIKTLALSNEFEGDDLQEAKDRFFREAESAGKLDHPNIVKIFDAGEEHDLAYIAMEFLKGKDLTPFTKAPNLLPLPTVLSIVERVAGALDHAHGLGVIHRDIKPANIMYYAENDIAKVTDFGIARVTDSSKTKTGMVLGTPSYMSPEQLAGKKIDGRSDLFSLGVMLYQLACGRLPFGGESLTQLMFKIANEAHPNILEYNPALPPWMKDLIDKALAKDAAERFQTGKEFAVAIHVYGKML